MTTATAVAGVVFDQMLGEPPGAWHPVARYGNLMSWVEQQLYADRRRNGVVFTAVGVSIGVSVGLVLRTFTGPTVATIVATTACSAGKMLDDEANAIGRLLLGGDLPAARRRLGSLVGRTTDTLDESEISRAAIESVAENSVDAVTASMFWAAMGGAPGVLAHRVINTMDAMVGHHTTRYEHFGWASARLDDLANHLPARLTTLSVAAVRPAQATRIRRIVRRDAHRHPSPNGGRIEAAYAAALNISLGGTNHYAGRSEDRGILGDGPPPHAQTIAQAVRLRRHSTAATAILMVTYGTFVRSIRRRRRRP